MKEYQNSGHALLKVLVIVFIFPLFLSIGLYLSDPLIILVTQVLGIKNRIIYLLLAIIALGFGLSFSIYICRILWRYDPDAGNDDP